jgi:hypothetical protein
MPAIVEALRAVFRKFNLALVVACLGLAACGGGGGGSAGGGGAGGESLASREFPDLITATFAEGSASTFATSDTSFPFTAPTSELPSNVQLIGNDGRIFTVTILATDPPNAAGVRTVTIRIQLVGASDFENPSDENGDNVYSFKLTGIYRGETLTTNIAVTITDVLDAASASATVINGEAMNQLFGAPMTSIPDVTGDGKPEIGVSIQSGLGPASAYIISSEFYGSIARGQLNVSTLGNAGARFAQTPVTTNPPNLNRAFAQQSLRPNLLTALPAASGVEILLSDAERKKLYLWKLSAAADFNAFRGAVNPDAISGGITYSFDPAGPAQEGRLIGDVNGDGVNDIFVQSVRAASGSRLGIIFGRASAGPGDLTRSGNTFDIEFISATRFGGLSLPYIAVQTIPDADRDGNRELALSVPSQSSILADQSFGSSFIWVIKSGVLRAGIPQSINLDSLTAAQGIRIAGFNAFDFIEIDDLDGDGLKSILVPSGQGGGTIVDGDELLTSGFGAARGVQLFAGSILPGNFLGAGGNLDGDAADDFVASPGGTGLTFVLRGGPVKSGLVTAPAAPTGSLQIDLRRVLGYSQFEGRAPVYLKESGLIGFGIMSIAGINGIASGAAETSGKIILVKETDIRRAVTTPSTGLEIN